MNKETPSMSTNKRNERPTRLSEILRLYMAVKGISQRELARQLDVAPSTMTRILNGKPVNLDNFVALLRWMLDEETGADRAEPTERAP